MKIYQNRIIDQLKIIFSWEVFSMSLLEKIHARFYQAILRFAALFASFPEPRIVQGSGTIRDLPELIRQEGITHLFLIIYRGFRRTSVFDPLMKAFLDRNIQLTLFDQIPPDPPMETVETAVRMYRETSSQGIAAIGGGSPMDVAKALGARIGNPSKSLKDMEGLLKITGVIPPLFLIPTTAGTGSEATLCSVITDSKEQRKFFLVDAKLVPKVVILDPELTTGLPSEITAATGMDALTHAIEAFLGHSNTKKTTEQAIEATVLIFKHLDNAVHDGTSLEARSAMQKAAFLAGRAFTRAYLGYVHAITHNLSGFYHIPHGEANAVFLPPVLEYYGKKAWKRLAQLAIAIGVGEPKNTNQINAEKFILALRKLSKNVGMPDRFSGILKEDDLPIIVKRVFREAHPSAPVPRFMGKKEIEQIIRVVM